ncbi:MAG TPA: glycosyltransferase [Gallicola sp.]|jgi:glycosyltransferase involved in cell wall biosynthesis|nr:glycosyltransferase [Gallicola sp.]
MNNFPKIKILHLNVSDTSGGSSIAARRLNEIMSTSPKLSSKLLVIHKNTNIDNIISASKITKLITRLSNYLNNLLCKYKIIDGSFSFGIFGSKFINKCLVEEADIIYLHWTNGGMLSLDGINKIILKNKPTVLFNHDMWYFTGGCHQSFNCKKYQTECRECPFFTNTILQNIIKKNHMKKINMFSNKNVYLISPSELFFKMCMSSSIAIKNNIFQIANILDTDKYSPEVIISNNKKVKVLYGAMGGPKNPYKGWLDFMYFAKTVNKKYENRIEFGVFGYNFSVDELKSFNLTIQSYGIVNDEDELISIYRNHDVFLFPSNQESFGQTLFEAMSCGLVPISYEVGAAPELIDDSKNGYLVKTGDKESLVDAFDKLMSRNIGNLKQNARRKIIDNFSKDILISLHLNMIFNLYNNTKKNN